jgi:hypothetical protein
MNNNNKNSTKSGGKTADSNGPIVLSLMIMKVSVCMDYWNEDWLWNIKVLGKKSTSVQVCQPQTPST